MPDPVDDVPANPADIPNQNPAPALFQAAGGCDASAVSGVVQDWYMHTQGYAGMYERIEQWTDCTTTRSGGATAPYVSFNYIDAQCNAWTDDKILYNTTFSACAQVLQTIGITASGSCSSVIASDAGWGIMGKFSSSGTGLILRPARKDSAGFIIDPSGYCTTTFNTSLGNAPGVYSCSSGWDTLANAKTDLTKLHMEIRGYCDTFNPDLVDI